MDIPHGLSARRQYLGRNTLVSRGSCNTIIETGDKLRLLSLYSSSLRPTPAALRSTIVHKEPMPAFFLLDQIMLAILLLVASRFTPNARLLYFHFLIFLDFPNHHSQSIPIFQSPPIFTDRFDPDEARNLVSRIFLSNFHIRSGVQSRNFASAGR